MTDRELAAEFVLGEIEGTRRIDVERRLRTDSALRAEVESLRLMTERLAELPPAAWPPAPPAPAAKARRRLPRLSLRPALAVASLLAALAIGIGAGELLAGGGSSGEAAPALTLQPLEPGSPARASIRMPGPDTMVLDVRGLPPAGRGHYYEVWLMTDASHTVPVASFSVNAAGKAEVRVPLPASPAAYRYFDVSRQATSQGTTHSGESVLRGSTA
ncbi:MAG: anti-sigma factor domain-containing protein [Syntrophothermus sp.]